MLPFNNNNLLAEENIPLINLAQTLRDANPASTGAPQLYSDDLKIILENLDSIIFYEQRFFQSSLSETYLKLKWYCDHFEIPFALPRGCQDQYEDYKRDVMRGRMGIVQPPTLTDLWNATKPYLQKIDPVRASKLAAATLLAFGISTCAHNLYQQSAPTRAAAQNTQQFNYGR